MIKECVICGTPFLAKDGRNKFCSDECKRASQNQSKKKWVEEHIGKRTEKVCVICGKSFMPTRNSLQKTCSEECHEELRKEHDRIKSKNRPHTMDSYLERLAKQKEETAKRKELEKKSRLERWERYKEEQRRQKEERQKIKQQQKAERLTRKCVVCGREFVAIQTNQKTCCSECQKKWQHRKFKKRLKGKIVDDDITLEALYKKDLGVCYLCGCKCDWEDKTVVEGNMIIGSTYPTVEHVVPLSKGGLHEWKNIRLSCFKCNTIKRDKML